MRKGVDAARGGRVSVSESLAQISALAEESESYNRSARVGTMSMALTARGHRSGKRANFRPCFRSLPASFHRGAGLAGDGRSVADVCGVHTCR